MGQAGYGDWEMTYRERAIDVPGAVLWQRTVGPTGERGRILPDGCLDLVWDGRRLFVAGPDSTARWHDSPAGASYVGLRFANGVGPAMLGVSADDVLDQAPALGEVWSDAAARTLTDRVAADPVAELRTWATRRRTACEVDPFGAAVFGMASAGVSVAGMADRLGLGARQLHRRCLPLFGYGPRRLARVLRVGQAIDKARAGVSLADVAADCGYADQAHLSREVRDLAGTTATSLLRELSARQ
jgi:AraC-like DNA-binding protein